jgi:hypothetical protein
MEDKKYSEEDLKLAFEAGRKQISRLTWGDDFVDYWKYTFKEWIEKFKKKRVD